MVCSFIDKQTLTVTTATIGDCESNIYRNYDETLKSIPLSCIRNWSSKKEAFRASIALNNPDIAKNWQQSIDPKTLRYPQKNGINVSRSLGNIYLQGTSDKPGLLCKPKITVEKLRNKDRLILCSDGLKDFLPEPSIIFLFENSKEENISQILVNEALKNMGKLKYGDNVTVLHIAVN